MTDIFQKRLEKCSSLMEGESLDALLLTKPANMFYLTGDGRLCAYAMITKDGMVALGVPKTDVEDVKKYASFDEYTFLTMSMKGMLTHPHAKPDGLTVKDCTHIMSELRIVKDQEKINRIRAAAKVAVTGMKAAVESVKPGVTESQVAAEAEYAMRQAGAEEFWRSYVASGERTNIAHGLPAHRKLRSFMQF